MRILLFGEFSGLFVCLKDGLERLGHEVYTVSNGDYYKDYPADFRYDNHVSTKLGFFRFLRAPYDFLNLWIHRKRLIGFDVVYFVDPSVISRHPIWNASLYRYMIKHNKTSFLCGAGDTAIMVDYWFASNKKYRHYVEGLMTGQRKKKRVVLGNNPKLRKWENELMHLVDGYIPIWYEYAEPFREYNSLMPAIRIPINWEKIKYRPNVVKGKVVFFHGIPNRPEAKGTALIKEAFSRMEKKYGEVAEFHCAGGLPFSEYMQLVSRTNVILDDANSYSIAMNGLFAMAQGKVVLGGAEPEGNKELKIDGVNPVFNIEHSVEQICSQIEYIINRKDKIEEWGYMSRKFVEKYHDSVEIAKQYTVVFQSMLKNI